MKRHTKSIEMRSIKESMKQSKFKHPVWTISIEVKKLAGRVIISSIDGDQSVDFSFENNEDAIKFANAIIDKAKK